MDEFASAVRHRNKLHTLSLSDKQVDDLIEDIHEHCYKKQIPVPTFLNKIHSQSLTSQKHGVLITELDELKVQKESRLDDLGRILGELDAGYVRKLERDTLTEPELAQIRQDRPLVDTIAKLRLEIEYLEIREAKKTSEKMGKISKVILSMPDGLYPRVIRASELLMKNPLQLKNEIDSILKKEHSPLDRSCDVD